MVVGENRINPEKNLPRPRFVHHETHMERPRSELGTPVVGGERLTACATRPPQIINKLIVNILCIHGVYGGGMFYTNYTVCTQ